MAFQGQQHLEHILSLSKEEMETSDQHDRESSDIQTVHDLKEKLHFLRFENKHLGKKLRKSQGRVETLETILERFQLELEELREEKIAVQCEQECRISELTTAVKSLKKELDITSGVESRP